ncbi:hypothetical protein BKA83DRAFT_4130701 [Pisolithus microcarpus]|nr:hypothetical protein BKA83DRAFT_4130701 [Pisolithus microcarpus]
MDDLTCTSKGHWDFPRHAKGRGNLTCTSEGQGDVPQQPQEAMMGNPTWTSKAQRDVPPQPRRLWWAIPPAPTRPKGMSLHSLRGYGGQSLMHLQDPKGCPSTAQEATVGNPTCTSKAQRDVPPQPRRLWWAIPPAPTRPKGMSLHSPGGYDGQSHLHL